MKKFSFLVLTFVALLSSTMTYAQEPYIAEIRMFAGTFAPNGWLKCEGQALPIAQYSALFSLLGTTYGGNGITTFNLPDLRGRVPMHSGQGPGLSPRALGQMGGAESVTLTINNLPAHSHSLNANTGAGTTGVPTGALLGNSGSLDKEYVSGAPNTQLSTSSVGATGSNVPVSVMQPYTTVTFIIATQGIYPSQP